MHDFMCIPCPLTLSDVLPVFINNPRAENLFDITVDVGIEELNRVAFDTL